MKYVTDLFSGSLAFVVLLVTVLALGCGGSKRNITTDSADDESLDLSSRIDRLEDAEQLDLWVGDVDGDGIAEIALSTPSQAALPVQSINGLLVAAQTADQAPPDVVVLGRDEDGFLVPLQNVKAIDLGALRRLFSITTGLGRAALARLVRGLRAASGVGCAVITDLTSSVVELTLAGGGEVAQLLGWLAPAVGIPEDAIDDTYFLQCIEETPQSALGCLAIAIAEECGTSTRGICHWLGILDSHCYQVVAGDEETTCTSVTPPARLRLCDFEEDASGCCNESFVYETVLRSDLRNMAPLATRPRTGSFLEGDPVPKRIILGAPHIPEEVIFAAMRANGTVAAAGCLINGLLDFENPIDLSVQPNDLCATNTTASGHVFQGIVRQCIEEDRRGVYSTIRGTDGGRPTRFARANELTGPWILDMVHEIFQSNVEQALGEINQIGACCDGAQLLGAEASIDHGDLKLTSTGDAQTLCQPEVPGDGDGDGDDNTVPEPPTNTAAAIGDPHLHTFDGVAYDVQAVGELTLVKSSEDGLEIQTRMAPWGTSTRVALNIAVAARVGDDRIALYREGGVIRVNGVETDLPEGRTNLAGGGRVYRMDDSYSVVWPDNSQTRWHFRGDFIEVEVFVPDARRNKLEGLLGDLDGSTDDELVTRDGNAIATPPNFYAFHDGYVESWRVTDAASLFDYGVGETTETYADRSFPSDVATVDNLSLDDRDAAKVVCAAADIDDPTWLSACVLDVGTTGDPRFAEWLARRNPPELSIEVQPIPAVSVVGDFEPFEPDPSDTTRFDIVQTIPPNGSSNVNPRTPVVVFFNDEIDPSSLDDLAITIGSAAGPILGRYSGSESTIGNTIMFFQPFRSLPPESLITVTLAQTNGLLDDGGNTLASTYSFSFTTGIATEPPQSLGFEDATGWSFTGDATILMTNRGDVVAQEGTNMAVLSTGSAFGGVAISNSSSTITSGLASIPAGSSRLLFDWNFASAEFDAFVGQNFDDYLSVTIAGPAGATSLTLASVNSVGVGGSTPVDLSPLTGFEHTGWQSSTIDITELGSPLTVCFSISDVGDTAVDSAAFIDTLRFE